MGGLLGKPPKPPAPDNSLLEQQQKDRDAEKAKVERENRGRRRSIKGRRGGFRSLLFNDERGVTDSSLKSTLG